MKKPITLAIMLCLLIYAATVHAGYFFVTAGADTDNDGDTLLSASKSYSTLAACQAALPATVVQGCVANCDRANPSSEYFLEEIGDGDNDGFKGLFHGLGPYGFQADCEAGITDAAAAGANVLSSCTIITQKRRCR